MTNQNCASITYTSVSMRKIHYPLFCQWGKSGRFCYFIFHVPLLREKWAVLSVYVPSLFRSAPPLWGWWQTDGARRAQRCSQYLPWSSALAAQRSLISTAITLSLSRGRNRATIIVGLHHTHTHTPTILLLTASKVYASIYYTVIYRVRVWLRLILASSSGNKTKIPYIKSQRTVANSLCISRE